MTNDIDRIEHTLNQVTKVAAPIINFFTISPVPSTPTNCKWEYVLQYSYLSIQSQGVLRLQLFDATSRAAMVFME